MALIVLYFMSLLRATEPGPATPWADSYEATAEAIAHASEADPLGKRERLADQLMTAAILTVMSWQESRFRPDVVGDGGGSYGLFQVSPGTAGVASKVLLDPEQAAPVALRLIHTSFSICRDRPVSERLGWYAQGGKGCDSRLELSRHRMNMAETLVKKLYTSTGAHRQNGLSVARRE